MFDDVGSKWLNAQEAADIVGVNLRTIHAWINSGQLPGTLITRKTGFRVNERDLHAFLRSRAVVAGAQEALRGQGKTEAHSVALAA